jgi:hypothetical protein
LAFPIHSKNLATESFTNTSQALSGDISQDLAHFLISKRRSATVSKNFRCDMQSSVVGTQANSPLESECESLVIGDISLDVSLSEILIV